MSFYSSMYKIFKKPVLKLYRVHIIGAENEPENANYIVCSNHMSFADVLVLAASLKRPIRFMAKAELFKIPLLNIIIKALGAYPVKRGTADIGAVKHCISLLSQGEVAGIFPQGTRKAGINPRETEIKDGVGMIAYRSGADILPVCIRTKDFRLKPFGKTEIVIGKLIDNKELNFEKGNMAEFKSAANYIFSKITDLI